MASLPTRIKAVALAIAVVLALPAAAAAQDDDPLGEVVAYLGGEEALTDLAGIAIEASGTRTGIDEGPTPGSLPGVDAPYEVAVTIDISGDRMRLDHVISTPAFGIEDRAVSEVIDGDTGFIDGQFNNFAPPDTIPMLPDRLNSTRIHQQLLNPHLLVLEALADPSLVTVGEDVEIEGTNHHAFEVGQGTLSTTLLVDAETGQPRMATRLESDPLRRDVEVVVSYGDWSTDAIPFPSTVTVTYDGVVVQEETRTVATDATVDEAMFEVPEGVEPAPADPALTERGDVRHQHLQTFAGIGFPLDGQVTSVTATELAPGIHHVLGGSHHSLAVIQDEGVVIVDVPRDEVQAAAIMDWLETVAPDLPVTHVVQSHHHADHSAGLRPLAGTAGAVAVVGAPAVPFYEEEVFGATSDVVPDGVDGASVEIMGVDAEGVVLESMTNPVTVRAFPNPHADDYVVVEAGGVLFLVDIYSPGTGGTPPPELVEAIDGLGLEVTTVAGGHGASEPWPSS
jgi:glyoxylase-like metal-dependent hydrolase (beta-lactamase superfamily II)